MPLRPLSLAAALAVALALAAHPASAQLSPGGFTGGNVCQLVQPSGGDGATALSQLAAPAGVATWLQGVWLRSLAWVHSEATATARIERVRRVAPTSRASRRVR